MSSDHSIVFVHLGPALPAWTVEALAQARLFNSCPIILAAEATALEAASLPPDVTTVALEELGVSPKQAAFRQASPLDRDFRGGFWTYTTERFFVLESIMARLGLRQVVHLENDVLLYADLAGLAPKLAALYPGLAATFDNDQRCVPGLVYVADAAALSGLTDFILFHLARLRSLPPEQLRGLNDMSLLGGYRIPGTVGALPVVPPDYPAPLKSAAGHAAADPALYSRDFAALGLVFDAAALGQYLGGVDPRNQAGDSRGFINESCVFDARLLKTRMVIGADGLKRPVVETSSGIHPVANLHIHAKALAGFLSSP